MCSQMSVLAPSGGTIKEYVISFNLFLKTHLQWVSRWIFDLVGPSPKEVGTMKFPACSEKTMDFFNGKGGICIVIGYLLKYRSKPFLGIVLAKPCCTHLSQTSALIAS